MPELSAGVGLASLSAAEVVVLASVGLAAERPVTGAIAGAVPVLEANQVHPLEAQRGRALRHFVDVAIDRLEGRASALGGTGIVGIEIEFRFSEAPQSTLFEVASVLATGIPVRPVGAASPGERLRCTFRPADLVALLAGGWRPVDVVVGIAVASRHPGLARSDALALYANANQEVAGYSQLFNEVRGKARDDLSHRTEALGADGFLLEASSVRHGPRFHAAEAVMTGTAIIRSGLRTHEPAIAVMPLTDRRRRMG